MRSLCKFMLQIQFKLAADMKEAQGFKSYERRLSPALFRVVS